MKILIVEDDEKTSRTLRKGLEESGYVVDVASEGESGAHLACSGSYDLLILDVMLPRLDGWAILPKVRQARPQTAVLLLTARDALKDRVRGLNLGADDYLVKPFAFSELLARMHAVLRRSGSLRESKEIVRFADVELDLVRLRATRGGRALELTPKEFLLLSLLLRRAGEVLSRAVIAEQVWDLDAQCDSNVVEVHMRRLRTKLDDPYPTKLIHTIRGFGYVLEERR